MVARWPNIGDDLLELKTSVMDAGTTPENIIDGDMPDYDYRGAYVWVHASKYWGDWTSPVQAQGEKSLVILNLSPQQNHDDPAKRHIAGEGADYYVFGIEDALDADNEWYYVDIVGATIITDEESESILLDDLKILFPYYTTQNNRSTRGKGHREEILAGRRCTIQNSEIGYSSAICLVVQGEEKLVFNCYVHDANTIGGDNGFKLHWRNRVSPDLLECRYVNNVFVPRSLVTPGNYYWNSNISEFAGFDENIVMKAAEKGLGRGIYVEGITAAPVGAKPGLGVIEYEGITFRAGHDFENPPRNVNFEKSKPVHRNLLENSAFEKEDFLRPWKTIEGANLNAQDREWYEEEKFKPRMRIPVILVNVLDVYAGIDSGSQSATGASDGSSLGAIQVVVSVFDISGKEQMVLLNEVRPAGMLQVNAHLGLKLILK